MIHTRTVLFLYLEVHRQLRLGVGARAAFDIEKSGGGGLVGVMATQVTGTLRVHLSGKGQLLSHSSSNFQLSTQDLA